jgi:hypothetical protein
MIALIVFEQITTTPIDGRLRATAFSTHTPSRFDRRFFSTVQLSDHRSDFWQAFWIILAKKRNEFLTNFASQIPGFASIRRN